MFGLGVSEILIVLVIALIFLGPKKLPALAKGLGKGLRNFQDALRGVEDEIKNPTINERNEQDQAQTHDENLAHHNDSQNSQQS